MVLAAFATFPILTIIFVWLLQTILDISQFLFNILIGLGVLMWFILSALFNFIYNCWWYVASLAHNLVMYICARVCLPIDFTVHALKHFSLLSLSITHLVFHMLYYVFLLWIFVYLFMLLFCFINHRDWAVQFKFYVGPTPRNNNI